MKRQRHPQLLGRLKLALLPCLGGIGIWFAPSCGGGELRKFKDLQGREITAEIVSVKGALVTLSMGGKSFDFPVAKLSESDQNYLRVWKQFQENTEVPEVSILAEKKRTVRDKVQSGNQEVRKEDWVFEITLANQSKEALENLELQYSVYYWDAQVAGSEKKKTNKKFSQEVKKLSGGGAKLKLETEPVTLYETIFGGTYVGGENPKKEDKLEGIWVRLYQGEKVLSEFKTDTPWLKEAAWPVEKKAK